MNTDSVGIDARRRKSQRRTLPLFLLAGLALWLGYGGHAFSAGNLQRDDEVASQEPRPDAFLVRIPLPIDQQVADQVGQILRRVARQAPPVLRPEERAILILKFDTDRGQSGAGSRLSSCMELAQLLTSEELIGLRTVAYVPAFKSVAMAVPPAEGAVTALQGHAVLVAVAAETIMLDPQLRIGQAESGRKSRDPLTVDIYRNLASKRLTLPLPIVLSMVDPEMSLTAVTTGSGEELADASQLQALEAAGQVTGKTTLARVGETAAYDAETLAEWSVNCRPAKDRSDLAAYLKVDLSRIETESAGSRDWQTIKFQLPEFIDSRTVDWAIRSLEQRVQNESFNLLIIEIPGSTGNLDACLKLARYLAGFDPDKIQTAAWTQGQVAGPAAIVALSCSHLLMDSTGKLGGNYPSELVWDEQLGLPEELDRIASQRNRDPGVLRAMLDLKWQPLLFRQSQSGEVRWMTLEQQLSLPDEAEWQMQGPLSIDEGFEATFLESRGIARSLIDNAGELAAFYQITEEPVVLTPTKTDRMLDRFASFLARPMVSVWLLMGAMFLFSAEMNSPGLGVPGFLAGLCITLFFWSQYLDGNAEWFEILLFLIGAAFVLIEIFVIPGLGIFGIGGLIMMVISIVLATQTFVVPRNAEDYRRLPVSLGMVLAAACSFLGALVFFRRYAKDLPIFNRLMLEPPVAPDAEWQNPQEQREHEWIGRRGVAVTRLIPAGKAKIAGKIVDVITDGAVVEPRSDIRVVEVAGNRILVEPIERP